MSAKLEAHSRANNFTPSGRFNYRGIEYCVAEGGPLHDDPALYPKGYFQTAYYVMKGDTVLLGATQQYDLGHDPMLPFDRRGVARIAACRKAAESFIDASIETGAFVGLARCVNG